MRVELGIVGGSYKLPAYLRVIEKNQVLLRHPSELKQGLILELEIILKSFVGIIIQSTWIVAIFSWMEIKLSFFLLLTKIPYYIFSSKLCRYLYLNYIYAYVCERIFL